MLKRKINKTDYESLHDELKKEYKAEGDSFILDFDGDDTSELVRAKDREKQLKKEALSKYEALKAEYEEFKASSSATNSDLKTLQKSWDEKLAKKDSEIAGYKNTYANMVIENTASQLASEISTAPKLLMPHIKSRFNVDFDESGSPVTTILDASGKPSALTLDELKTEIVANKDFSAIIVSNKSSGGTVRNQNTNRRSVQPDQNQSVDYSKMSAKELAAHIKSSKEEV